MEIKDLESENQKLKNLVISLLLENEELKKLNKKLNDKVSQKETIVLPNPPKIKDTSGATKVLKKENK